MKGSDNEIFIGLKESNEPLLNHEKVIYDMLVKAAGNQQSLTLRQLKDTIKDDPEWAIAERNSFNAKIEKQFNESRFNTAFFDTLDKVQKTTYRARVIESSGDGDGGGFSSSGGGSNSGSGGGFAD